MDAPPSPVGNQNRLNSAVPGLAIASLVLGIVGLLGSIVVVGGILAIVGLVLGAIHLRRGSRGRGLAWAGVWVSIVAIAASAGVGYAVTRMFGAVQRSAQRGTGFGEWHGKPAPTLELTTLDGAKVRLDELRGRRVVVDFWATWCGPCVMEIPHLIRLQKESGTNELTVIGISNEDRTVLKRFAAENGINYLVASAAGMDLPDPYVRVTGIPTTFFIDKAGVIEHVAVGYHEYDVLKRFALGAETGPKDGAAPEAR